MMQGRANAVLVCGLAVGLVAMGLYGCAPAEAETLSVTYYYLPG